MRSDRNRRRGTHGLDLVTPDLPLLTIALDEGRPAVEGHDRDAAGRDQGSVQPGAEPQTISTGCRAA